MRREAVQATMHCLLYDQLALGDPSHAIRFLSRGILKHRAIQLFSFINLILYFDPVVPIETQLESKKAVN